jgi:hypothetical protein
MCAPRSKRNFVKAGGCLAAIVFICLADLAWGQSSVLLDAPDTKSGYLATLLINEAPFPGERGYRSEADSEGAMLAVLWVLQSRLTLIPKGYTQQQVTGVRTGDVIDVITGAGGRRQCEGFCRDASGRFVTAPRVLERVRSLVELANSGGKPGRFTRLLNYAQGLARAYDKGGIAGADRYAALRRVGSIAVTGRAYSWMTDVDSAHPGGNFVTIPDADDGVLGGNRFFTLRKKPK